MSNRKLKVLVTGAAGSAGSFMLEHLLRADSDNFHFGLVRNEASLNEANLAAVAGKAVIEVCDLEDFEATVRIIKKVSPDQIYHFASNANVLESFQRPVEVIRNNVLGTSHLLEACRLLNTKPRFLMCSTSEVYGQVLPEEIPIKETNALRPASPYAVSKTAQDMLSGVYFQSYGLPVIRSRMFTYINPRRENLFATAFVSQVVKIEFGLQQVLKHGNLNSIRTHMDIRDGMAAYLEVMKKGTPGEIYNLGGTEPFSVGEFLNILKSKARCEIKTEIDDTLLRPTDVTLQVPDISKFESITDWKPSYGLNESIDFLLQYYRRKMELQRARTGGQ